MRMQTVHIDSLDMIPAEVDMEIVPRILSHVDSSVLADTFLLDDTTVVEVCKEWEWNRIASETRTSMQNRLSVKSAYLAAATGATSGKDKAGAKCQYTLRK